jgi:hypothetical protein
MKKDIEIPKVTDVGLAVIREKNIDNDLVWMSYLINMKPTDITGVLISSKGYGSKEGEEVKTSVLRHFFEKIEAKSYQKIELIPDDLLTISNEFWISFYVNQIIYDKKYVFLAQVIQPQNFTLVPIIEKPGILIL